MGHSCSGVAEEWSIAWTSVSGLSLISADMDGLQAIAKSSISIRNDRKTLGKVRRGVAETQAGGGPGRASWARSSHQ